MKNEVVNAPIKFEKIVMVMINAIIPVFLAKTYWFFLPQESAFYQGGMEPKLFPCNKFAFALPRFIAKRKQGVRQLFHFFPLAVAFNLAL